MDVGYKVCVYVETPPKYLKLYRTTQDYNRGNPDKIAVLGNPGNLKDVEQYNRLRELYDDVTIEFIDTEREKDKAQELLDICFNASYLIVRIQGGYI